MTGTPQAVLSGLSSAARFLTVTVGSGGEKAARDVLAGVGDLCKAVGFRVPGGGLTCVVGIGAEVWPRLFATKPPAHLHPFREVHGGVHHAPATPGDLLFHLRAERADLCFQLATQVVKRLGPHCRVVDEVDGFRSFEQRDLLGFVDGTANPTGQAAVSSALDADGAGYVIVQKYLHDLDGWNALSVEAQEAAMGRTKLDDIELDDKKPDSHVAVNTVVDSHGVEHDIVRDNMPFGAVGRGEFGTYYIGYAADPAVPERMLHRMFVGEPPGNHDRILDFSTAVTGGLFYVPSADFLGALPDPPH
ncbi:Dyp-type peroxidase [Actinomadura rupiterrae]|uniref:Dyp-type peroxidase n=1 Tax=Actinomadura rupiterrae TaxID=559627 RepID=UPI0020A52D19|nr:Dyp-type peroxidase [Actinomadura rupiterrae]MCP2342095.1 putative iron-dependent peroxidase [Actinomadura rupiterrae]